MSDKHAADLELARRCAIGDEAAWDRFVLEFRPVLYRAADMLEPGGGARDLADALYADLYGVNEHDGERRSLFRYFQGRSSLATWLRAVLSQRYVDRVRERRRFTTMPDEDDDAGLRATPASGAPRDLAAEQHRGLLQDAIAQAVAELSNRDRLRLGCYYRQQLTLAETGRILKEHEATVSRRLARTRSSLREAIERRLRGCGLNDPQIAECFAAAAEDSGTLDLGRLMTPRKKSGPDRSSS